MSNTTTSTVTPSVSSCFGDVGIDRIRGFPFNNRRAFDQAALEELAASIREKGLIEPIVLREIPGAFDEYVGLAGERRWRAAQLAGLTEVPARIYDAALSDADAVEICLVENLQRQDVNSIEQAEGFAKLVDLGKTHDEIAERCGLARPSVSNSLRLLALVPEVRERIASGALTAKHGMYLLRVEHPRLQRAMARVWCENEESATSIAETLRRSSDFDAVDALVARYHWPICQLVDPPELRSLRQHDLPWEFDRTTFAKSHAGLFAYISNVRHNDCLYLAEQEPLVRAHLATAVRQWEASRAAATAAAAAAAGAGKVGAYCLDDLRGKRWAVLSHPVAVAACKAGTTVPRLSHADRDVPIVLGDDADRVTRALKLAHNRAKRAWNAAAADAAIEALRGLYLAQDPSLFAVLAFDREFGGAWGDSQVPRDRWIGDFEALFGRHPEVPAPVARKGSYERPRLATLPNVRAQLRSIKDSVRITTRVLQFVWYTRIRRAVEQADKAQALSRDLLDLRAGGWIECGPPPEEDAWDPHGGLDRLDRQSMHEKSESEDDAVDDEDKEA